MFNPKKFATAFAATFVVFSCLVFMFDTGARYTGYLRAKNANEAHRQIEPAYLHGGNGIAKDTFEEGEPLFAHEHYVKLQACHMTIANIFKTTDTNYIYRGETYLTWMEMRESNFSEHVEIPKGLPPGSYRFLRKTVAFCGGEQVFYTLNFDLPLTIVAKK